MSSLILYLLAFVYSALCAKYYQKKNHTHAKPLKDFMWAGLIMLLPIMLACYRYGIGVDYDTYLLLFDNFHKSSWISFSEDNFSFEYLNKAIVDIGYFFTGNVYGAIALYSILTLVLSESSLIYYKDKISLPISTIVLLLLFYPDSLNVVRQSLACAIIFYSTRYIVTGDLLKYFAGCIIATGFHTTAIIAIVFFLFNDTIDSIFLRNKVLRVCIIVAPLFLALYVSSFQAVSLFSRYFDSYDMEAIDITASYILKIPVLMPILANYKYLKKDDNARIMLYLFAMEMMLLFSSSMFKWGFRLSYYCFIGQILLCGFIAKRHEKNTNLYSVYVVCWYLLNFYLLFYVWGRSSIFPYTHL